MDRVYLDSGTYLTGYVPDDSPNTISQGAAMAALLAALETWDPSLTLSLMLAGHFVPSKASWRNFFRDYIRQLGSDVPSPGLAGISQPPSGAVTPSTPAGSGA
ncbi:hypothetical protein PHLCEN_2v11397 [Hermanssonia centrifuga]|uniref:Uncharacterized protein n=1 Tax=Hermanssonia centrifuga TaxID=98765 RepID=A0A2R6NL28_9APHY|nr:hypothetical protein PHLCEN_2v11397 [Hermanssonia centrifuga]